MSVPIRCETRTQGIKIKIKINLGLNFEYYTKIYLVPTTNTEYKINTKFQLSTIKFTILEIFCLQVYTYTRRIVDT